MKPDSTNLLKIAEITNPFMGFYDTPAKKPFESCTDVNHCIFSCYQGWMRDESTFFLTIGGIKR